MIKEERKDENPETHHASTANHDLSLPFLCDLVSASREDSSQHKNKSGFGKTNMDLNKISSLAIPPTQKVSPTSTAALRSISGLGLTSALVDSTMNLSPPCGDPISESRVVYKVKRFLSTLIKFGADISSQVGEKVKDLVFNLVAATITVSEFHHLLQDVTNFPLRPFVLPFLQANIPLLQREVAGMASSAGQSCIQYLRNHESFVLEQTSSHSPTEASEIFHSEAMEAIDGRTSMEAIGGKRKNSSHSENGDNPGSTPIKRPRSYHGMLSPPLFPSAPVSTSQGTRRNLVFPHQWNPNSGKMAAVPGQPQLNNNVNNNNNIQPPTEQAPSNDDEWKNIHVMLNCILGMVEKTQRALGILQQRHSTTNNMRTTEELVAEVQHKAQSAVNEVKEAAIDEIRRALGERNNQQTDARINLERAILDLRSRAGTGGGGLLKLGNFGRKDEEGLLELWPISH